MSGIDLLRAVLLATEHWKADPRHERWDGSFISFTNARGLKPPLLGEDSARSVSATEIKDLADAGALRLLPHQANAAIEYRFTLTNEGRQRAWASHSDPAVTMEHDIFISHASEDKASVARPLADAMKALGWTVWLDELELTVGDSLSGRIDAALARSRFGVVVLSPAFFAKEWPQRELAGLAAREVTAGTKVILPVWHDIDDTFLIAHSPTLADRLGASTSSGLQEVADKLSTALRRAGSRVGESHNPEPILQAVLGNAVPQLALQGVPTTIESQERLIAARPSCWEYLLFAGVLLQGKNALETKWHDHELRIPSGEKREFDDYKSVLGFFRRETRWVAAQLEARNRIFGSEMQERAWGQPGEHGDPIHIRHFARHILTTFETLLDWAASIRNTSVPSIWEEVRELTARMVDQPLLQIRTFIDEAVEQFGRLPRLLAERRDGDPPFNIDLLLELSVGEEVVEALTSALDRAASSISAEP